MFVVDLGLWTDTRLANWIRNPLSSLSLSVVVLVHLPFSCLPSSFITTFLLSDFFSYLFIFLVLIYHYVFILLSVLCLICPSVFVYFFLPFTVLFSTRQYGPPFCKVSSNILYSDRDWKDDLSWISSCFERISAKCQTRGWSIKYTGGFVKRCVLGQSCVTQNSEPCLWRSWHTDLLLL